MGRLRIANMISRPYTYKGLLFVVTTACILLLFYSITIFNIHRFTTAFEQKNFYKTCYEREKNFEKSKFDLEELIGSKSEPVNDNNIFFHETSCLGVSGLNPRQACAVESAALHNPNRRVYLLQMSNKELNLINQSDYGHIFALLNYSNVHIKRISLKRYVENTPLDEWYNSGALEESEYLIFHASDVLRYLTLWRYGGTYLDLDVVILKSLENLKNFAGAENFENVAAGVINFSESGVGRDMSNKCILDLRHNFSGTKWGNNGPGVITRVLEKRCDRKMINYTELNICDSFLVFPPKFFYPVHWTSWKDYFIKTKILSDKIMEKFLDSYAIHLWNKFSAKTPVKVSSLQPYAILAKKHCPKVIESLVKDTF